METQLLHEKLIARNYSRSTQRTYLSCFKAFLHYFKGEEIADLRQAQLEHYFYTLAHSGMSTSTLNQHINSVKFYYEKVLRKNRNTYVFDRPKKGFNLPNVLSVNEMQSVLKNIHNLKHLSMIALLYACGLRIGELICLQIKDVDSQRMQLFIHAGKGKRDRYVPLDAKMLRLLRNYYKAYRPEIYLFNGQHCPQYSPTSVRKILKLACKKASIQKKVTPHTLRHSYATHLLEDGIDLRYIQVLLGHQSVKTTEIYTHVKSIKINEIVSPFSKLSLTW